ncbi:Eco57I restriction-modification methylase domain-containing protein [Tabrizicola piscis]|uniref:Eco57I restriction-modification methylase domain-containing protein n=1 Tax=Tabrizicola piscis TaxID=2494374 RepID=UPI001FE3B6EC|nr:Eco57I restriction-modification methylase domain-containing protein [Tabrizicola piscis]
MTYSTNAAPANGRRKPATVEVEKLANFGNEVELGAIYTRPEVAEFILDLVGYTADAPLLTYRILEPSFGAGGFLRPIVRRLLASARLEPDGLTVKRLAPAISAVELYKTAYSSTCDEIVSVLQGEGISSQDASTIVSSWLRQGDFLLLEFADDYTHIVGNPPYVRQDQIPDSLIAEYRSRYSTIYDRADLYVPFIERSLDLLQKEGKCGFICADRWMKNKYGQKLREKVANNFSLDVYIDMTNTNAFLSEVSAYPAITVLRRGKPGATRVAANPDLDKTSLAKLCADLTLTGISAATPSAGARKGYKANEPWLLSADHDLTVVRRIEANFPQIEAAGCRIGIGVATGADQAFIGAYDAINVEPSRKLRLVMTKDLFNGSISWRGYGVVNPFGEDGKLVNLSDFPKLAEYLYERSETLRKRHVAAKNPNSWYRTIDRIYSDLYVREKLLIPDIRGTAEFVHEAGHYYPHHNLYYIVSETWDLHALRALLQCGIAKMFVSLYSTKMRGGYLRFQAQNLRRIRLPAWHDIPMDLQQLLTNEGKKPTSSSRTLDAVSSIYQLTKDEVTTLRKFI